MKTRMLAMVLACCATMTAQISSYLGPGVLTRGAGDIGTRAGQDVSLRYFVNATGIFDNGLEPFAVDSTGHLITVNGLWGTEIGFGAYGVHNFQHARLGLDYNGIYRHYSQQSSYDGTDHTLALGYTYQKSEHLIFDMRQMAGSISQGMTFGAIPTVPDAVVTPSSLLFDNRMDYLQSTFDMTYVKSPRTSFTMGGDWFGLWRSATGLIGMQGYTLRGSIKRRMSRRTTLGVNYEHSHYDYPKAFGQSDIDSVTASFATQLGQHWTVSVNGGAYQAETQGLQQVAVDPAIAALLGVTSTTETFYQKSIFPQWGVNIGRQFHHASLSFGYQDGPSGGNGIYLTSRTQSGTGIFSYTATRKWSFSANGGYYKLAAIGQTLQAFGQVTGGVGLTYALTRPIHLTANYDARHQSIVDGNFRATSFRAAIGIAFSPGDVPLAFH